MKCLVVTPEKTVLNMETTYVILPLADGEYGILSKHTPLIARLGAGELRITGTDGQLTNYYVEGGFAEVLDDTIALLTMFALPAKDLDLAEAEKELEEELASPTETMELMSIRHEKLSIDRAKVRLAQKMAGQVTPR